MRATPSEPIDVPESPRLPAPAVHIVRALRPLLTEARLQRIEEVIADRTRAVTVVLDRLIDPHNVAAVMRSADAFGVQELHVVESDAGFTASPRVAKGSQPWLDIRRYSNPSSCLQTLRERGFEIHVATMNGERTPEQLRSCSPIAVVLGNEHEGVGSALREQADGTFAVPMRGFVESLNVSVAAAITLYALTRERQPGLSEADREQLRARFYMASVREADLILQQMALRGAVGSNEPSSPP